LVEHRSYLDEPALIPADRHEVRRVPSGRVDVAGRRTAARAGMRQLLGPIEVAGANGEHDVDRVGHETDRLVVLVGEMLAQLAQVPLRMRVAGEEHVHRQPEQADQEVDAASGAEARAQQFASQLLAQIVVIGAQQATVRDAESVCYGVRIAGRTGLVEEGECRGAPAGAVVGLAGKPDA